MRLGGNFAGMQLGRLGVASRLAEDKRGKRLATVIIVDGKACDPQGLVNAPRFC